MLKSEMCISGSVNFVVTGQADPVLVGCAACGADMEERPILSQHTTDPPNMGPCTLYLLFGFFNCALVYFCP